MRRKNVPQRPRKSSMVSFPAPVGGWVSNQNLANPSANAPQGAYQLTNFFPTATGAELRGGSILHATLGATVDYVLSFLKFKDGSLQKLFGATEDAIYDITTVADPDVSPTPVVSGLTGGIWSSTQFATTGGVFLVAVNGEDDMRLYDGTSFYPISDEDLFSLAFDAQTAPFVVGGTLTGGTSAATGKIVAVQSNGTSGSVVLETISGVFVDNETITGSTGGSATSNGIAVQVFVGVDGVETRDLSYVWSFKNRLFFVEKDTQNAWYFPVDQLGGTATIFPLGGVFKLGGSLLFGLSWSVAAGDGLQDACIFISTEGEIAVYQGTNPSSAADWQAVGVYQMGKPLGQNAFYKLGGDVIVATDIGFVPLSKAVSIDPAALAQSSLSYMIETAWNEEVLSRRSLPWQCAVWPERQMVVMALPTVNNLMPRMFAMNANTYKWADFSNWDARSVVVFNGRMFYGTTGGRVIETYASGLDIDATYTGVYVPLFDDLRTPASLKIPKLARPVLRSTRDVSTGLSVQFDYMVDLPAAPSSAVVAAGNEWGIGVWGQSQWGAATVKTIQQEWESVSGSGYALAPALQITSGSIIPLATEIVRIDMTYTTAEIVT